MSGLASKIFSSPAAGRAAKNWKSSLEKKKDRLKVLKKRAKEAQAKIKQRTKDWAKKHEERMEKKEQGLKAGFEKLENTKRQRETKKNQGKNVNTLNKNDIGIERGNGQPDLPHIPCRQTVGEPLPVRGGVGGFVNARLRTTGQKRPDLTAPLVSGRV